LADPVWGSVAFPALPWACAWAYGVSNTRVSQYAR